MSISSRFAVGIHILTLIEFNKDGVTSSDYLAGSVNTNPALIRKIMAMLKKADLIEVKPGVAGAKLTKDLTEISLYDVYRAVSVVEENELFSIHDNPNPACPVGQNIQTAIEPIFIQAQSTMESVLKHVSLADVVNDVATKSQAT
ncbi:Rrf2 family transcriptional regulator [Exiguobacterium alkaliphilum]|uniref:Rrf2 family transcriptional regulator n=1 Tax=Exiguobacterium alkaliphilum TaxID=1428684 RepID=A0ABT2KYN6_9BACL|nr:Rrf2 family transcriptional regulator [Exiguobacterium alkaliphilum]MCT4796047.1 Rrf2 family transcriptional regulator [Exiguobacterium alkaliphilum]